MAFRKILVCVEASSCSIAALQHAVELAQGLRSELDALRVVPTEVESEAADTDSLIRHQLDELLGRAAQNMGPRFRQLERTGEPTDIILQTCAEGNYDLLVLGTHGRMGRMHMLVHSVAETVMRNASCPVLTVRMPNGAEESFKDRLRGGATLAERSRHRH